MFSKKKFFKKDKRQILYLTHAGITMQDGEIQRELLKETRSTRKALELAIIIKMGIRNQFQISGTAAHSTSNQAANMSVNGIQISWKRPRKSSYSFVKPTICPNCGYGCSAIHRQNCPARGKNCKNCGIAYPFAKVCSTKVQMRPNQE